MPEVVGGVAVVELTDDVSDDVIRDRDVNKSPPLIAPEAVRLRFCEKRRADYFDTIGNTEAIIG